MDIIQKKYEEKCRIVSDINENLPILKKYSEFSDVVIEMGVRSVVSTWALLSGKPKKMISIDLYHPSHYISHDPNGCEIDLVKSEAIKNGIDYTFIEGNVLEIDMPICDFLFIDTKHDYEQLKKELELHSGKVKKYIAFHDTVSFKDQGETPGDPGIWKAIQEFLDKNIEWKMVEHATNNNGMTVIQKKQ
jgi:hypothetical protein